MSNRLSELNKSLNKLNHAVSKQRSDKHCLRLWSSFVRLRDGGRCIICDSCHKTAAHHIFRKSFLFWARYETGNGITLCKSCHREPHAEFNQKPNLLKPVDYQGGENIDLSIFYLSKLLTSAKTNNLLNDDFYCFSDTTLAVLKRFQGIPDDVTFSGYRLEQAYTIWQQTPWQFMNALWQKFLKENK